MKETKRIKAKLFVVFTILTVVIMAILAQDLSAAQGEKVDINTATLDELKSVPGIGPKIAQEIINGRPYKKVDELLKIKGISEKKLAEIRSHIEVKKINVNFASVEELQAVPGIGPKVAQEIINGRPYKKIEDLLKVKGFGEKKLAKIRDLITTKVNINSATSEQLQTLPRIGADAAKSIIDGRPYKKVEDLLKVKGIGDAKLKTIRDLIEI